MSEHQTNDADESVDDAVAADLAAEESAVGSNEAGSNESGAADDATAESASPSLEEQLEATRAERDEAKDRALRAFAELENGRRRFQKEREDARKYAVMPLAKDLLPGVDNLRRALDAADGDPASVVEGVRMVLTQLEDALKSNGVQPIETEGQSFDPNHHEALTQVPNPDVEPMTILQEVERGYILNDRVLRPSKVVVAMKPPEGSE